MQQAVLITGGAGYIGSHSAWLFAQMGYQVIIIDNLHYPRKFSAPWAVECVHDDCANTSTLSRIFREYNVVAVLHCAAFIEVSASLKHPRYYYHNNVFKTAQLLDCMLEHGAKRIIFSSSCALYGIPEHIPIEESHQKNPITPYGKTKHMVEQLLEDYAHAYGIQYVNVRYFNAAGGLPEYGLYEQHEPETHVIPLLLQAIKMQQPFKLFGNNYKTPDGSCIRDFLHVIDIAHAHYAALKHLERGHPSDSFNLGTGIGISLKKLVSTAENLFDTKIKTVICPPREGDPPRLVADPKKAEQILGWSPRHSSIKEILLSAYASGH